MAKQSGNNLDPSKVRHWITLLIALLSALAGALGEASAHVMAAVL